MLFNSIEFIIFLLLVYVLYWFVLQKNLTIQNFFLLIASYVFYGWWDWRFLLLLILSTIIDYSFGLLIYRSTVQRTKKLLLWLSIFNNLAILGFFKYYNFFADSTKVLFSQLGMELHPYMLSIALPVGISFYTFHGMSYVFDIYNGKAKPSTNPVNYSVFVCFFPLLVAGPIERGTHLLPQVEVKRVFNYRQSVDGLRLMLWGFFKKIVIADSLAQLVDTIFKTHEHSSGLSLMMGAVAFAIQIYGDFSGYSDIARGTAKLFGFELLINFRFPYFSRDIAEFWRRWHISLSSWFRDYLYIPLGGSKGGKLLSVRNTFIIFLVSGFWHGANWTYIFWGGLHAVYFLPLLLLDRNRKNNGPIAENSILPSVMDFLRMVVTFIIVCIAWVFFRASSIGEAFTYLKEIVTHPLLNGKEKLLFRPYIYIPVMLAIMLVVEWICRNKDDVSSFFDVFKKRPVRYVVYALLCFMIVMYGAFEETSFIYFQF
jgi:alginate O-acetyltransferase complex protein AlgI